MRTVTRLFACTVLATCAACASDSPSTPAPTPTPSPTPAPTPQPTPAASACEVVCWRSSSVKLAIAYSPKTRFCGIVEGAAPVVMPDLKRAAKASCASRGATDCEVLVWGTGGVGAVAASEVAYGWGWADHSGAVAEQRAIEHCRSRTR